MPWMPNDDDSNDQGRLYDANGLEIDSDDVLATLIPGSTYTYRVTTNAAQGAKLLLKILPASAFASLDADQHGYGDLKAVDISGGEYDLADASGAVQFQFTFSPPDDFKLGTDVRLGAVDPSAASGSDDGGGMGGLLCNTGA